MMRAAAVVAFVLVMLAGAIASADIGEPAGREITRLQASHTFATIPSVHGWMPEQNLERWKFTTANGEQRIFAIDARHYQSPVVHETYIVLTQLDPFSLRPGQATGRGDLTDVLSPREYEDFSRAASVATIPEAPIHKVAYFYRGSIAAYEVIEPSKRAYGSADRFEWRAFARERLPAMMKAARSCDNGPDCAAW